MSMVLNARYSRWNDPRTETASKLRKKNRVQSLGPGTTSSIVYIVINAVIIAIVRRQQSKGCIGAWVLVSAIVESLLLVFVGRILDITCDFTNEKGDRGNRQSNITPISFCFDIIYMKRLVVTRSFIHLFASTCSY